jgi:transglutaminase-like putative cysteine protease
MLRFALTILFSLIVLSNPCSAKAEVIENGGYQFEVNANSAPFESLEVPKQWPTEYQSDSPFRIWLLDHQSRLDESEFVDYVFEAQTSSMLAEIANYSIEFAPSWQRLVIHELSVLRKGAWQPRDIKEAVTLSRREAGFEQGTYDGNVTAMIVVKDVAVNELIRIRYSLLGAHPLIQGAVGFSSTITWSRPILKRRILVTSSPRTTLVHRLAGRESEFELPKNALKVEQHRVELNLNQVSLVPDIDAVPLQLSPYPRLTVAPKQTWQQVRTLAMAWFESAFAKPAPEVQALADKLDADGLSAKDPRAYAQSALRHVQDQVRYFAVLIGRSSHRPHAPEVVIARGYGDCKDKTQLLTALLRAKGIDAVPSLVNLSRGEAIGSDLPDVGSFDHVIVRAKIDGKEYWLDPTIAAQGGDLDQQGFADYGFALTLLAGDAGALQRMVRPKVASDLSAYQETYSVAENESTELLIQSTWHSNAADNARAAFARTGRKLMQQQYTQYYERLYGSAQDASLKINDQREVNTFEVAEQYRFEGLWKRSGALRFADIEVAPATGALGLPQVMNREVGLYFSHPTRARKRTIIELPKGARLKSDPEDIEIKDPAFEFKRTVRRSNDKLEIEVTLQSRANEVGVADLDAHFKRRREALDASSLRIIWAFPELEQEDEREREQRQQRYRNLLEKLKEEQQ